MVPKEAERVGIADLISQLGLAAAQTRPYRFIMLGPARKWLFALGAAAFLLAFIVFIAWFDASVSCAGMPANYPPGKRCAAIKFVYDWQQLLGGLFAIAAAAVGWIAINRQIHQTEDHEAERHRRKRAAAQAMLPLALSGINEYAQECADALLIIYDEQAESEIAKTGWVAPKVPFAATADLRSMIEALTLSESRPIAELISLVQIQASRLRSLENELRPTSDTFSIIHEELKEYLIHTIKITALADSFYRFARGEEDFLPSRAPSTNQLASAASSLGMFAGLYPKLDQRLNRRIRILYEE